MAGEKDLDKLIKNMSPRLNQGEYVFCTVVLDFDAAGTEIIGSFIEEEGKTLVINKEQADRLNLPYDSVMSWITLKVHSSLNAVGLTAKVSAALAEKGISCNVIAAYYHDHIFVGKEDAEKAIKTLLELT